MRRKGDAAKAEGAAPEQALIKPEEGAKAEEEKTAAPAGDADSNKKSLVDQVAEKLRDEINAGRAEEVETNEEVKAAAAENNRSQTAPT